MKILIILLFTMFFNINVSAVTVEYYETLTTLESELTENYNTLSTQINDDKENLSNLENTISENLSLIDKTTTEITYIKNVYSEKLEEYRNSSLYKSNYFVLANQLSYIESSVLELQNLKLQEETLLQNFYELNDLYNSYIIEREELVLSLETAEYKLNLIELDLSDLTEECTIISSSIIINEPTFSPIWPVTGFGFEWITNYYSTTHLGLDIAAYYGTPVIAVCDGEVVSAEYHWSWGNNVFIEHDETYSTRYAHLCSMVVSVGDYVNAGDIIGFVGSTGNSTGNHLHFEVYENGVRINPYEFYT